MLPPDSTRPHPPYIQVAGGFAWSPPPALRPLQARHKWLRIAEGSPERGAQTVKKPRRAREGRSPFELSIVPGGMYGGHGTVFASENPIFQRKKRFLAGSAPEKSSIFSGDWRGWQWRGSLLPRPPACQNFFDKLTGSGTNPRACVFWPKWGSTLRRPSA